MAFYQQPNIQQQYQQQMQQNMQASYAPRPATSWPSAPVPSRLYDIYRRNMNRYRGAQQPYAASGTTNYAPAQSPAYTYAPGAGTAKYTPSYPSLTPQPAVPAMTYAPGPSTTKYTLPSNMSKLTPMPAYSYQQPYSTFYR